MADAPETPAAKRQRFGGQGQWALGHREPLTPNERTKRDDDPLNVRKRIETIYARGGFSSIGPADLRGRFRWFGLYTQRKPGILGNQTALLEPEELEDRYFMQRIRIDGGQLDTAQLRAIAEVSTTYARDTADITDRQNIQLHWVRIEDVPAMWAKLEATGLLVTESCGDTPRVILGSPVAGIDAEEILDGTPAIRAIVDRWIGDPSFSNLPRKFKSAVSGSPHQDVAHEVNDLSFVGVVHPEHGPGFDVWAGGGLSTNPHLAQRLGAWVPLEEVAEVWAGVVALFRDYGYRRLRHRARMKFLVADWGIAKFREVLETEYLKRPLLDGPEPAAPPRGHRDHLGVHRQQDGRFYVGAAPAVGRVSGTILAGVAHLAEAAGSNRVRLTVQQQLLILDVPEDRVPTVVEGLRTLGLHVAPSAFRRGAMACTGIEYCKLAITATKAPAISAIASLEERLPEFATPLSIHVNGCPNSCARIQTADIGFKGQIVTAPDGRQVEGFQVHLGGGLGLDSGFGRKLRGHKVTAEELPDYIERVAKAFESERADDESFPQWAARAGEDSLR